MTRRGLAAAAALVAVMGASRARADDAARFSNRTAAIIDVRREALERRIKAVLDGASSTPMADLREQFSALEADFRLARTIPPDQRDALAKLMAADARLLEGGSQGLLTDGLPRPYPAGSLPTRVPDVGAASVVYRKAKAAAQNPAAAAKTFDNQKSRSAATSAASRRVVAPSSSKEGDSASFAYVKPGDPRYRYTNAARLSLRGSIPAASPAPAARAAAAAEPPDQANCEQALNNSHWSIEKLCRYSPMGAAALGGLVDALYQQFSGKGLVMNIAFMLMGILMGALTGGAGILIKALFALGMSIWAVWKIAPQIYEAVKQLWNSKEGSVERYAAIRQLAALAGGIMIMALFTLIGGKLGKAMPEALESKLGAVSSGLSARLPAGVSAMMAKFGDMSAPTKIEGESRVAEVADKPAPKAVHSAEKAYMIVSEDGRGAPEGARAAEVAKETVRASLEKALKPGERPTVAQAKAVLAEALVKADAAVRAEPATAGRAPVADLAVGIVARDASGTETLVSASAGESGIFLKRGGELVEQRPPQEPLAESGSAMRRSFMAEKSAGELAGQRGPAAAVLEAEPAAAAPRAAEPLGSENFRAPEIVETPLKPRDTVIAASERASSDMLADKAAPESANLASDVAGERMSLREETPVDGEGRPSASAELTMPEKPGLLDTLINKLGDRESVYRAAVASQLASNAVPAPLPYVPPPPASAGQASSIFSTPSKPAGGGSTVVEPSQSRSGTPVVAASAAPGAGNASGNGAPAGGGGSSMPFGPSAGASGGAPASPNSPSLAAPGGNFDGSGGGGGGGGAGGSGGGAGGASPAAPAGASARSTPAVAATQPSDQAVVSAPSPGLPPIAPARKKSATAPSPGPLGGHAPERSLASRFDGSQISGAAPRAPAPNQMMHGVGGGGGGEGGLPRLAGSAQSVSHPAASAEDPASADDASPSVAAAGDRAVAPANGDEDYNYTYLAPARQRYDLPTQDPKKKDWRYLIALAARSSAALAAAYLLMHSDAGYLAGLTRRRRDS